MKIALDRFSQDKVIEALIHNTPIAYIVLDDQYRIHFLNDSFLKLRNLNKEDTLGEVCYNISNKGVPCDRCAVRVGLESKRQELVTRKDILPDGSIRYLDDYAFPLVLKKDSEDAGRSFVLEIMIDRSAVKNARAKRIEALSEILETLIEMLESKDAYTAFHSKNVHRYARLLAQEMGLDEHEVNKIAIGGLLHDIGKVDVPDEIINKPDKLNDEEYRIIKGHPVSGDDMLEGLSQFIDIKEYVRHHHERPDGKGYPDSIDGQYLSVGSKILAIADTYDAMTTDRPYRQALSHEETLAELRRVKGTQLDADLVECFAQLNFSKETLSEQQKADADNEVVRNLSNDMVKTEDLDEIRDHLSYRSEVDESEFLWAIFENTPCGYVLFDREGRVLFASDYYLDYLHLESDSFVGSVSHDELIARSLQSQETLHEMREESLEGENKIYELFSIPVLDNEKNAEYVIWCTIDRTEEVELARSFDHDLVNVIKLVRSLVSRRFADETSEEQIAKLERRLMALG